MHPLSSGTFIVLVVADDEGKKDTQMLGFDAKMRGKT